MISSFPFAQFPLIVLDRRSRAYLGLAVLVLVYIGGILGWSWAAVSVDEAPSSSETVQTRVEAPSTFATDKSGEP